MNKYSVEIVRDFNGVYYVNLTINGEAALGVDEYVGFKVIRKQLKEKYNIDLPKFEDLTFTKWGRKSYSQQLEGTC